VQDKSSQTFDGDFPKIIHHSIMSCLKLLPVATSRNNSKAACSRSQRSGDSNGRIFQHNAAGRRQAQPRGRFQKDVGMGLTLDNIGAGNPSSNQMS
jgi:hypothetical protein